MVLAACAAVGVSVEKLTAAAIAIGSDFLNMVNALLRDVPRIDQDSITKALPIGKLHNLEAYVQFY